MLELHHLAIRYRLGLLDTEALIAAADALLAEGRDTPTVIELLILEPRIMADATRLFERICAELKVPIPTKEEAINGLIQFHLQTLVSGTRSPREGLEAFMSEVYWPHTCGERSKKYVGDSRGLEHLIGSYWSYDELEDLAFTGKGDADTVAQLNEDVRQQAKDWLQNHGPPLQH